MSDPDAMDRLLRRSLTTASPPTLSPEFEKRLTKRLQPRRLRPKSRNFLLGYSLVGLCVSFGAMYVSGMDWRLAGLSVLAPLVVTGAITLRFFRAKR